MAETAEDRRKAYESFLAGLSPENRRRWDEAVKVFAEKFGDELLAEKAQQAAQEGSTTE